MYGEHHHIANLLPDLVAPVVALVLGEEAAQALRGHVLGDLGGVAADPRHGYGVIVDVGGVDLDIQFPLVPRLDLVHQLQQHHGNRIDFLAGSATGHPDPECVALGFARQQRGQNGFFQRDEGVRVAEKTGDIDQQFVEKRLHLGGILFQVARIDRGTIDVVLRHAPLDATGEGALLVVREIVAGASAHLQQDLIHAAHGFVG